MPDSVVRALTVHRRYHESKGQVVFKFRNRHDTRMPQSSPESFKSNEGFGLERWRARQDLNPRHRGPKPRALSVFEARVAKGDARFPSGLRTVSSD